MQSDRELLELAAKAAGYVGVWFDSYYDFYWIGPCQGLRIDGINGVWNPLEDDGDALRLAVKLGIGTRHHDQWSQVFSPVTGVEDFNHDGDSLSATRRAIVRAAAAMAKA